MQNNINLAFIEEELRQQKTKFDIERHRRIDMAEALQKDPLVRGIILKEKDIKCPDIKKVLIPWR